jgi:hypothetical protein
MNMPTLLHNPDHLVQALDDLAIRRTAGDLTPLRIELADGDFALQAPLLLEAGKHDHLTLAAAQSATPRLHSRQELTGWKERQHLGRTVWSLHPAGGAASCGGLSAGRAASCGGLPLHPRTLIVNGIPASRARYPKEGFLTAIPYEEGQVPGLHMGTHRIPTRPGDIDPDWQGLADAELVALHFWCGERLPDLRFDPETHTLVSSHRTMYRLTEGTKPLPLRYYVENLADALTEPGAWCFVATTGELLYLPREGETLENTRLEIPVLHRLIELRGFGYGERKSGGGPDQAEILQNIHIEGLTFEGCDWVPHQGRNLGVDHTVPTDGKPVGASVQGAFDACSACSIQHADNVEIRDCDFHQLGGHAVRIGSGCRNVNLHHNHFHDLGGGAVIAHGADLDGPSAGRTRDITVADNHCHAMGRTFPDACGILGGAVERMHILHNDIHDLYYSGISLGWTWGYADTVSRDHRVEGNIVEDVSQGMLNDLGGIYLVGANTGSVIRGNLVRRVHTANFGAQGIYLDEGCRHIRIEQNQVEDCGEACINMHYGEGHLIRDNLLIGGHAGIRLSRDDGNATWTATRNLIIDCGSPFSAGYALGNLAESSCQADLNLIHPGTPDTLTLWHPPYLLPDPLPFTTWQAAGNDRNSLFEDPGPDPAQSYAARKLGFRPRDPATLGPRKHIAVSRNTDAPADTNEFEV